MGKGIKKLVTHDASFHTDDIFAAATLAIMIEKAGEKFEIIRTRDEEIIKSGDYVFDIGGVYDEAANRFDHHQIGGAGKRMIPDGKEKILIEYASFGLVWKKFGEDLCGSRKAADLIEKRLAIPIDAWDNGFSLAENKYEGVSQFLIQHIFFGMEPTWREEDADINEIFLKCVEIAKQVLSREIMQAKDAVLAEELVTDIYKNSENKKIIILEKNYPFQYVLNNLPEPLFVIYPRKTNNWWGVKAVRKDPKSFSNRKDLPAPWAGLRDEELQKVTGVPDAIFCHRGRYMAVAKSKEGAIKLAEIALES